MATVYKYRIRCNTDAKYEYAWAESEPTTCPVNTAHAIDSAATAIVETVGPDGPLNGDGYPITAPSFEDNAGLDPKWEGFKYSATAGALSFFDEVVTTERRIRNGWYEILDTALPVDGDYVEFSIVDKDDVLGLFATYGLTVGVDVLELKKYVRKDYVAPGLGGRQEFRSNGAFLVTAGLYFRTTYNSVGSVNVKFKTVIQTYE